MKNEIRVPTWEECEAEFRKLLEASRTSIMGMFFRGHASAEWSLDTTLERRLNSTMSFADYYRRIFSIRPAVETFTNSNWDMPTFETIQEWSGSYDARHDPAKYVLAYDYLAHLRHNGFPSLCSIGQHRHMSQHFSPFPSLKQTKSQFMPIRRCQRILNPVVAIGL